MGFWAAACVGEGGAIASCRGAVVLVFCRGSKVLNIVDVHEVSRYIADSSVNIRCFVQFWRLLSCVFEGCMFLFVRDTNNLNFLDLRVVFQWAPMPSLRYGSLNCFHLFGSRFLEDWGKEVAGWPDCRPLFLSRGSLVLLSSVLTNGCGSTFVRWWFGETLFCSLLWKPL